MTPRAAPAGGASGAQRKSGSQRGFTPTALARQLEALIGPLRGARFGVAFSGGADSMALLAACAALRARHRLQLRALHVDHRLQPAARAMARAARASARRLGVSCQVIEAPVIVARGESTEAAARAVRYAALHGRLQPGEWLLLAQHQDDQVEAVLLQLLRGAGIAGLAAMPARSGRMLRPLLGVPRPELLAYLRRRSLAWIDDPSNADERLARNFLRLRVLPLLRERWPGIGVAIGRSAALAAEARRLLAARAEVQLRDAQVGAALAVTALRRLSSPDRHNLVRYWLEQRGLPMPDQRRLLEIGGAMLRARPDAQPSVHWPGALVRRHGGLLHASAEVRPGSPGAIPDSRAPETLQWDWLRQPQLALPDGSTLELRSNARGSLARGALPPQVTIAFRRADGTVSGRAGGRRLKRALREAAREPWRRGAVPLVYAGRRLLAVGDTWHAPQLTKHAVGTRTSRCRLRWFRN